MADSLQRSKDCLQKSLADLDTLLSVAIFKLDNNDDVCVKPFCASYNRNRNPILL